MKPKIIHSFWSRPLETQRYGQNNLKRLIGDVWMFALSLAYIKRCGYETELHTDTFGSKLLGHLPYDAVVLSLNDMPRGISPRFWAAGKFSALEAAGDNAVHIDGDVFIKNVELLDSIKNVDAVVQHREWGYCIDTNLWNTYPKGWAEFCNEHGLIIPCQWSYNTGVIGIFDRQLRSDYIEAYRRFTLGASERFGDELTNGEFMTPDLFAEQVMFYEITQRRGADVLQLIEDKSWLKRADGYQHLLSGRKYNCIDKVKETLKRLFPDIYTKTFELCQNI